VTHNSDGEQTRPYAGPPPAGARWPEAPTQPGWTPPPVGSWPPHRVGPPPTAARGRSLRWAAIGVAVVAIIAAAVGFRMALHKQPAQAAGAAPSAASSPTASSGVAASPSAGPSPANSVGAPPVGPTVRSAHLAEFLPIATTLTSLLIVEHLVQITDSDSI
jgi:hypothetical protein